MSELVEPELSYEVVGLCMKVHSQLGSTHKEKYYQTALAQALKDKGISFEREMMVPMYYDEKEVGHYFLDFLIGGKIVVELKVKPEITPAEIKQVLSYLKTKKIKLGIIVNFGRNSLEYKRILNNEIRENKS